MGADVAGVRDKAEDLQKTSSSSSDSENNSGSGKSNERDRSVDISSGSKDKGSSGNGSGDCDKGCSGGKEKIEEKEKSTTTDSALANVITTTTINSVSKSVFNSGYSDSNKLSNDNNELSIRFSVNTDVENVHLYKPPVEASVDCSKSSGVTRFLNAVLYLIPDNEIDNNNNNNNNNNNINDNNNENNDNNDININIKREGISLNEFTENDELLMTTFPLLWFKGSGLPTKGTVNKRYINYLFRFHDGRFAQNHVLIFALFNMFMRHAHCRQIKAHVATDPKRRAQVEKYMSDPTFPDKLREAISKPEAKTSIALFRELNALVKVSSAPIPFSLAARSAFTSKMYSLCWKYGTPFYFLTWAPDDVRNILSIRLCSSPDSSSKIGTSDLELIQNVLNKTINYADLKKLVSLNPASSTRIFHETNKLIFDHIIGIPIDGCGFNTTRKSVSCANRTKGAFGKALAFAGVGEISGRFAEPLDCSWRLPLWKTR